MNNRQLHWSLDLWMQTQGYVLDSHHVNMTVRVRVDNYGKLFDIFDSLRFDTNHPDVYYSEGSYEGIEMLPTSISKHGDIIVINLSDVENFAFAEPKVIEAGDYVDLRMEEVTKRFVSNIRFSMGLELVKYLRPFTVGDVPSGGFTKHLLDKSIVYAINEKRIHRFAINPELDFKVTV